MVCLTRRSFVQEFVKNLGSAHEREIVERLEGTNLKYTVKHVSFDYSCVKTRKYRKKLNQRGISVPQTVRFCYTSRKAEFVSISKF